MKTLPFLLLLSVLVLCGCSKNKPVSEYSEITQKILVSDEGIIRGVDMGLTDEQVKKAEKANLTDESGDYLYYDQSLNESDYFTISYYFEKNKLYEINTDAYLEKPENATLVYNELKEFFSDKFGDPKVQDKLCTWKAGSSGSPSVEISLTTDTSAEGTGYISLNITDYNH